MKTPVNRTISETQVKELLRREGVVLALDAMQVAAMVRAMQAAYNRGRDIDVMHTQHVSK